MNFGYPYNIDGRGRTAQADEEEHIRNMIEQLLFTTPGERVNRPDFGCGLMQLVFAPNSEELATTTQYLVQGALQQWMSNLIKIEDVQVAAEDSTLRVSVQYIIAKTNERKKDDFEFAT